MELTTASIVSRRRRRRRRRRRHSSRTMTMIMTGHRRRHHHHRKSLLAAILSAAVTILILSAFVLLLPRQARAEEYSVPSQNIFFYDEDGLPLTVDVFLKAAYKEVVSTAKSAVRRSLDPSPVLASLRINGDNQVLSLVGLNNQANADIRSDIESVGGSVVACGPLACTCWIPIAAIAKVSELPSVKFLRAEMAGLRHHQGSVKNEAVRAHYVDALFDVALTGTGLKIGVLSDSYDTNSAASTRATDDVSTGDLPNDVVVLRDAANGSDAGRVILQLIHDIAPDAKLYFRTGFLGAIDFADGIIELAKAGCNVIVDDIGYFDEPFFLDGGIARAASQVAASPQNIAYISAEHGGTRSCEADFVASSQSITLPDGISCMLHQFGASPIATGQFIDAPDGAAIVLQWTDPFYSETGGLGARYNIELLVFSTTGDFVGGSFLDVGDPVERVVLLPGQYVLSICAKGVTTAPPIRLKWINIGGTHSRTVGASFGRMLTQNVPETQSSNIEWSPPRGPTRSPHKTYPRPPKTKTPSRTPSFRPSGKPSVGTSPAPSVFPTTLPSPAPSESPNDVPSGSPSKMKTISPSSSPSGKPSVVPSRRPSRRPISPSKRPSSKPSISPTKRPSSLPSSRPSKRPSSKPSAAPIVARSAAPSSRPSKRPSSKPTTRPSKRPSSKPSSRPSKRPSSKPSSRPSKRPSSRPSATPNVARSAAPSSRPSTRPSSEPSAAPIVARSAAPSSHPSKRPSKPSTRPSKRPSSRPSAAPNVARSAAPSSHPSKRPSSKPSSRPSERPSSKPSSRPSKRPSSRPSATPNVTRSAAPSSRPSKRPSLKPSSRPSKRLSLKPSSRPSKRPSSKPSAAPNVARSAAPSSRPSKRPSAAQNVEPPPLGVAPVRMPTLAPTRTPRLGSAQLPTLAPARPPTQAPVRPPSRAPTPSPLRQVRVSVTVNATQALSESFIVDFEEACGRLLTDLPYLPETTCKVQGQQVVSTTGPVVLSVLVEADVPGLDVLDFATIVTDALRGIRFIVPFAVTLTREAPPTFISVVTLRIDKVQNGRLTPGGIRAFEAGCREFFTVRVGNPNFRCLVLGGNRTMLDEDDSDTRRQRRRQRQRALQSSSPVELDVMINAGAGTNPTQPNTQSDFVEMVGGALSGDSDGLIQDVIVRADSQGVPDFQETTSATVENVNKWNEFLEAREEIIRLIVESYGGP